MYIYILYSLYIFFIFFSFIGIQNICSSQLVLVRPKPLIYPSRLPFGNHVCCLCLWVYFCFVYKLITSFLKVPHISDTAFVFGLL